MKFRNLIKLGAIAGTYGAVHYTSDFLMKQLIARDVPKLPDFILKMLAGNTQDEFVVTQEDKKQIEKLSNNIKETIYLRTEKEGLKIVGRYYPADKPSDLFLVLSHGCRCNGLREFAMISEYYHKLNYNLLIVDHRACGDSEGEYMGFGYYESSDTMLWLDYLNNRFGKDIKIFLHGVSMGAATVLMMSSKQLPENVKGIIADCSYTSAWDEFSYQIETSFKLPVHPILDIVNLTAKNKAGYDFKNASPLNCVKNAKVPILFIHGAKDEFVPEFMVNKLYNACCTRKDLLIVPDAIHARSFQKEPELYINKVKGFIKQYSHE